MNISRFHFDVKVTDMADYDYVEELEVSHTYHHHQQQQWKIFVSVFFSLFVREVY